MISYIEGKLLQNDIDDITVLVYGLGYKIYIPNNVQQGLPKVGEEVKLYIHHHVREDNISLYGFVQKEDLELFEQLLDISKIGPKVGLSILSTMPTREFKRAIVNNEVSMLKEIKGIGIKTAKRIILELQEKIDIDSILKNDIKDEDDNRVEDAIQALLSLGYNRSEVCQLVINLCNNQEETKVEDIIKEALLQLS